MLAGRIGCRLDRRRRPRRDPGEPALLCRRRRLGARLRVPVRLGPHGPFGEPIGGRSLIEGSLEARIKITDTIGIVPFFDAGTAFESSCPGFRRAHPASRPAWACATTPPSARSASTSPCPLNRAQGRQRRGASTSASGRPSDARGELAVLACARRPSPPLALGSSAHGAPSRRRARPTVLGDLISRALSTPTTRVSIGAVDGALSSDATIRNVAIADRDGVWLRLDRARLDLAPRAPCSRAASRSTGSRSAASKSCAGPLPSAEARRRPRTSRSCRNCPSRSRSRRSRLDRARARRAGRSALPARLSASGSAKLGPPAEGLDLALDARRLDAPGRLRGAARLRAAGRAPRPAARLRRAGGRPRRPPRQPARPAAGAPRPRRDRASSTTGARPSPSTPAPRSARPARRALVRAGADRRLTLDLACPHRGPAARRPSPRSSPARRGSSGDVDLRDDGAVEIARGRARLADRAALARHGHRCRPTSSST